MKLVFEFPISNTEFPITKFGSARINEVMVIKGTWAAKMMRNCNLEIEEQKCSPLSPKARLVVGAHVVSVVCPLGFLRAFYAGSAREAAFGENSLQTMKLQSSWGTWAAKIMQERNLNRCDGGGLFLDRKIMTGKTGRICGESVQKSVVNGLRSVV